MPDEGACRSCGRTIRWVELVKSGKRIPIDPHDATAPRRGLVCVNPRTKKGKVLAEADLEDAWRWAGQGATFHRSHFSSCPTARKHRKRDREAEQAQAEFERVQEKFPDLA